jgi:hypothetical protein
VGREFDSLSGLQIAVSPDKALGVTQRKLEEPRSFFFAGGRFYLAIANPDHFYAIVMMVRYTIWNGYHPALLQEGFDLPE